MKTPASLRRGMLCGLLLTATSSSAAGTEAVSFSRDLVPVLKTRCAACHLTGTEAGNMALHPRAAYTSLVGVPSVEVPGMSRVEPGSPAESYLVHKLEGSHLDAGGNGVRMPLNEPPLDADTLSRFRRWVEAGAPDN